MWCLYCFDGFHYLLAEIQFEILAVMRPFLTRLQVMLNSYCLQYLWLAVLELLMDLFFLIQDQFFLPYLVSLLRPHKVVVELRELDLNLKFRKNVVFSIKILAQNIKEKCIRRICI